jgi:branched-chain amino acid transport system ATP-binding protein
LSVIKIKNLTKQFGGLKAVSDVSIEVKKKEILGLIGPNGAGKTTLFNMIACSLKPTNGEILYKDKVISDLKPFQICDLGIARTFQITRTFGDLSLIENIMVGTLHKRSNMHVVREKAEAIFHMMGFSAEIDKSASNLTTVDRKKLEVARALATEPDVLLLDEVMAGCNPQEKLELVDLIKKLREDEDKTVVIIEHDIKTIMSLCDRIVVLHRGEKLIEGLPEDIANDPKAISAYLGEEYKGA